VKDFAASAAKGARRASPQHWPRKDNTMADEFTETDLETPSAHDLDEAYGSRFLGVVDVGDKKIRTKILKVRMEEVKDRDTGKTRKRPIVFFENIDKGLVLNVVNKNTLVNAFGKAPAGWLSASVGIYVDPNVTFGGQKKGGVRLRALLPPAVGAKPAAKPEPKQGPTPAAAKPETPKPATPWPEEKGDPGFDPDLNDAVPDFGSAA
jgi:hypothetical protein